MTTPERDQILLDMIKESAGMLHNFARNYNLDFEDCQQEAPLSGSRDARVITIAHLRRIVSSTQEATTVRGGDLATVWGNHSLNEPLNITDCFTAQNR
jgi:hypothetical protein